MRAPQDDLLETQAHHARSPGTSQARWALGISSSRRSPLAALGGGHCPPWAACSGTVCNRQTGRASMPSRYGADFGSACQQARVTCCAAVSALVAGVWRESSGWTIGAMNLFSVEQTPMGE